MAEPKQINLTSVANGHVLSQGQVELVARNPDPNDITQRWTVEAGDDENTFALKNVGTGKYMVALAGHAGGLTNTGEKQFWRWSRDGVGAAGAVRLSPVQYPQAFLNHFEGVHLPQGHPGIKVHMWPWVATLDHWLSWWFVDADGIVPGPQGAVSSGSGAQAAKAETEAKEKELAAKAKDLEQREAALKQARKAFETSQTSSGDAAAKAKADVLAREQALAAKAKDMGQKEAALARDRKQLQSEMEKSSADTADMATKQQELKQKEAALAEEARKQAINNRAKLDSLQKREAELAQKEKKQLEGTASGKTAAQRAKAMLDDLQAREKKLAQKEQTDAGEREKKLKALQAREAALDAREKKLATQQAVKKPMQDAAPFPVKANSTKQRAAPATNGQTRDDAAIRLLEHRLEELEKAFAAGQRSPGSSAAKKASELGKLRKVLECRCGGGHPSGRAGH